MYASMNFLTKSALRQAIAAGSPVVLYSPVLEMPAINGCTRCEGPWPGTPPPVEDIRDQHGRTKPRERVLSWHAEVRVKDMRVVAVL